MRLQEFFIKHVYRYTWISQQERDMPVIVRIKGGMNSRSLQHPNSYFKEVLKEGWAVGVVVTMPDVLPPECRCYIDSMVPPTEVSNGLIQLRIVTVH